jgi:hypothetical protein
LSAAVDARLDLLNVLRSQGFAGHDITLTESGHDFVVCLDSMQRLAAALRPPLVGPADDGRFHGPELDQAIERAPAPADLPVCATAFHERRKTHVDHQVEQAIGQQAIEGKPADNDTVQMVQLRAVIGGSFTYGMAVGLELGKRLQGGEVQ